MNDLTRAGQLIIVASVGLIGAGIQILNIGRIPFLDHLPGDIVSQRTRVTLVAPLATTLLNSLLVTLGVNLALRR